MHIQIFWKINKYCRIKTIQERRIKKKRGRRRRRRKKGRVRNGVVSPLNPATPVLLKTIEKDETKRKKDTSSDYLGD